MIRFTTACVVLCSPVAVAAAPVDALKPMEFLAGHCWKGSFSDGQQTDDHCFTWLYDGKALRDTHTVRSAASAGARWRAGQTR